MLELLNKYYPVSGRVALLFVGVLFVNLILASMAYGHIQYWSVWSGLFCGFMFGRWAEREMILGYVVTSDKTVEEIREELT